MIASPHLAVGALFGGVTLVRRPTLRFAVARPPTDEDDWRLLRTEAGARGLEVLFERHRDYVFRVAWGLTGEYSLAEDVTQEVFLRLAHGRQRFRPRAKLRTLLYRITVNTAREIGRRSAAEVALEGAASTAVDPGATPPPTALLTDLSRALATLPQRQREAVVLRYLEGQSTREAAAAMGCRAGTVKAHLFRGLSALRRVFSAAESSSTSLPSKHPSPGASRARS